MALQISLFCTKQNHFANTTMDLLRKTIQHKTYCLILDPNVLKQTLLNRHPKANSANKFKNELKHLSKMSDSHQQLQHQLVFSNKKQYNSNMYFHNENNIIAMHNIRITTVGITQIRKTVSYILLNTFYYHHLKRQKK